MVKVPVGATAVLFNVLNTPALVYYRKGTPLVYEGDLSDSAQILGWLTSNDALFHASREIELVNRRMLEKLLDTQDFVAVLFCAYNVHLSVCLSWKYGQAAIMHIFFPDDGEEGETAALTSIFSTLEPITEELNSLLNVILVRLDDAKYGRKWGVTKTPSLVYFRRKFPSIYRGELMDVDAVMEWLTKNRYKLPELNLFVYAVCVLFASLFLYTLFYLLVIFRGQESSQDGGNVTDKPM